MECKTVLHEKRLVAEKREAENVVECEKQLSTHATTTPDTDGFVEYLRARREVDSTLRSFYDSGVYARRAWRSSLLRQRSTARFIERIKAMRREGKQLCVSYGGWVEIASLAGRINKGHPPCIGKRLRREISRHMLVMTVPEAWTSQTCGICGGRCAADEAVDANYRVFRKKKQPKATPRETREALRDACIRHTPECAPNEEGPVAVAQFMFGLTQAVIEDKMCEPECACACHLPATIDHFELRNTLSIFHLLIAMVLEMEYDGKKKFIALHRSPAHKRDLFTFGDQRVLVEGATTPTTLFELEEACLHAPDQFVVTVDDVVGLVDSATPVPPRKMSDETPEEIAKSKVRCGCEWTMEHGYTRPCDCASTDQFDAPEAAELANCVVCNRPLHAHCYPTLVCRACQLCPVPCVAAMKTRADGWRAHRVPFTFVSLPNVQSCMLTRVHGPKNVLMSMLVLDYKGERYIAQMPHAHGRKLIHIEDAMQLVMTASQAVGSVRWIMTTIDVIKRQAVANTPGAPANKKRR